MRIVCLAGVLAVCSSAVAAQDKPWLPLTGAQIAQVLTGQTVKYDTAVQDFRASGRTLYNAGRDSWGYWAVRGDQYCSQWPPQDLWACYGVQQRGAEIRFEGAGGDLTVGVLIP